MPIPILKPSVPPLWKKILRNNFTRLEVIADFLELTLQQRAQLVHQSHFPLNVPLRLGQKMEKGTLDDPLVKQFLPTALELVETPLLLQILCAMQNSKNRESC